MHELDGAPGGALGAAAEARRAVTGVLGFDPPTWEALAAGARPPTMEPEGSQEVDEDGNMLQPQRSSTNTERSCSFT